MAQLEVGSRLSASKAVIPPSVDPVGWCRERTVREDWRTGTGRTGYTEEVDGAGLGRGYSKLCICHVGLSRSDFEGLGTFCPLASIPT